MTSLVDLKNEKQLGPSVPTSPQYASYEKSVRKFSAPTGFVEFSPRDIFTQAKYDGMQETWQGVESSDKAIASGLYALDYATDDRSAPTKPLVIPAKKTEKKEEPWFCVVQ